MPPRVRQYAAEIAFWHGVTASQILAPNRGIRPICTARADLARRLAADRFSSVQIGRWLRRDHSTILHHLKTGAKA